MQRFLMYRAVPAAVMIASLFVSVSASANPPTKERLPLMLSGSGCSSKEAEMNNVLQAIPGVSGIYFNRVPDHVLVDITPGTVKPADVVNRVNNAATSWHCKVELMQSCITAEMPAASPPSHPHE